MADVSGPSRFGKYELLSRLAKGGMAETFRAQLTGEAGVTKQVVIKKVLPSLSDDEEFIAAFIYEAKLSASLSHGNIAQVFDFGKERGDYFIAMELVDGRSLGEVLYRAGLRGFQRFPEPIACFLTIEMLKGLHYAHTRVGEDGRPLGIVHRDISPENILVSFEGQTKVVDFGVAKASQAGRSETAPGTVKGKFLHLSPEQALARPLDGRSDVYAVGILLYRMLCGVLPFEGQMHVAMHAIADGKFRPASAANPQLAAGLISVLDKAMATRREDRYASALEMQDALATILYSREPTFSSEMIQEWMRWLFADDLVREGRPAQVSPRFEQQLRKWSPSIQPSSVVVEWKAVAGDPTPRVAAPQRGLSGTRMSSPPRRFRAIAPWIAGASVLVAAAVGLWVLARETPVAEHTTPAANHATKDVTAESRPPQVDAITSLKPAPDAPALAPLPLLPEPVSPKPKLDVRPAEPRIAKAAVLFDDAKALTQERLYKAAAAKLDECLKLMPDNADCHRLRGNVWAREGQITRGEKEYREFLKYAPPDHPDLESVKRVLKALDAQR